MLKIRLQMTGRRNKRHFRIIVVEHTVGPKSGKYVEKIGYIDNDTHSSHIDTERAKYWMSVGAQPTDRVYNMLVDEGVIDGPKRNALPKKTPIVKETPEEEQSADNDNADEEAGESTEDTEQKDEAESSDEEQGDEKSE